MEQEANAFAGYVLVPRRFLKAIDDDARPSQVTQFDQWLSPQTKNWGVSTEMVLRRLLDTQRLDQAVYAEYRAMIKRIVTTNEGGMRHRFGEPRHIFGNTYVRTVLGALSAREITLSKASTYLDNIKIDDLHKLEKYYANT